MKIIIAVCTMLLLVSLILSGQQALTNTGTDHRNYHPTDKLFTAFVYTPLVQYKIGHRKRDRLVPFKEASAVMGYCLRHYEIGLGYDLTKQNYCGLSILPPPEILTMQAVSATAMGKYFRRDCDAWDMGEIDERDSQRFIKDHLDHGASQKTLASFLRVLCPTEAL